MMFLCSCEKNKETSEENNNEKYFVFDSTENKDNNENELINDDSGELPPKFKDMSNIYGYQSMTLLYKYDGYWSMRFDEYFRLDGQNLDDKNIHDK